MIDIGTVAPDFELEADSGQTIRLADYRGKRVVLYFYPKDDTSGCTKQACGFRDRLPAFEARDLVVLGVSPDGVRSHERFRDKYGLNFPLLSDPDHSVAAAYGAWGKKKMYGREYEGILRSTFIIGTDGRVEAVYAKVKPAGHADLLLEDLRSKADSADGRHRSAATSRAKGPDPLDQPLRAFHSIPSTQRPQTVYGPRPGNLPRVAVVEMVSVGDENLRTLAGRTTITCEPREQGVNDEERDEADPAEVG